MDPISNALMLLAKVPEIPKGSKGSKKAAPKKVPVSTKKQEVMKAARRAIAASNPGLNVLEMIGQDNIDAFGAGINKMLPFEAVNRIVAGGADLVGYGEQDKAGFSQKSFDRNMKAIRRGQDAAYEKNPTAYYAGGGAGLVGGGAGLVKGIQGTGNILSKIPGLAKAGKAIAASQTLTKGEKVKNLAKLAGTGAVVGAGESAVRGGDASEVATGAAIGAAAAPATVGALKGLGYISRPVVDLFRSKNYGQVLRRITDATAEEITKARDAYKARTNGAEPTLFEILPKGDRDRISKMLGGTAPKVQEQAAEAIQQRARSVEGEMLNIVDEATGQAVGRVQTALADDLATSRGRQTPTPSEEALASQATKSPLDLEILRSQESGNIMQPFDDTRAYNAVEELFPNVPELQADGSVKYVVTDPEVATIIKGAAGSLRLTDNITVNNLTKILRNLKKKVERGNTDEDAAQRAINHIEDIFIQDHPAAAAALGQMNQAFAGKSRVLSGFDEGKLSRVREQFNGDKQTGINVFDTPEGAAGRALGQTAALRESFSGTPQDAMRGVGQLAENTGLQRAVSANLDDAVAAKLTDAARAQEAGLRALGDARKASERKADEADISVLGDAMLAFNPASFPLTRAAAVARLVKIPTLGEKKASMLVDMLFSQDPTKIKAGIGLLNDAGRLAREALFDISAAVTGTSQGVQALPTEADYAANDAANPMPAEEAASEPDYSAMSDEELMQQINGGAGEPDYSAMSDEELMQQLSGEQGNVPYGAQVISSVFPDAVITDAVRDPNSDLGQANPGSYHVQGDGAVDVRPIPGMSFDEFIATLQGEGYEIVEAIDEVNNPSGHATGPHWHVVFA
jgi:hypothetical protein